jgi:hypothetical protein
LYTLWPKPNSFSRLAFTPSRKPGNEQTQTEPQQ